MSAPGERIVAQGVQSLGRGVERTWSRWDTGVVTWEDHASLSVPGSGASIRLHIGEGRADVPPAHVKMVDAAALLARIKREAPG